MCGKVDGRKRTSKTFVNLLCMLYLDPVLVSVLHINCTSKLLKKYSRKCVFIISRKVGLIHVVR